MRCPSVAEPPGPEQVVVIRGHSVHDSAGNTYGIVDLHADPSDVAVLLGVRSAVTGERTQLVLRERTAITRVGLRVQALSIDTTAPERVTLLVERQDEP
jgi:hypothetical protein